ncbi:MAG: hypothetical protein AB7U46_12685 [Paenirhodobacter sp.]|uniref:hypothetical protein n=1 Tax=Paenirhodobacter sp. TaxID=1965326 RepID=UPI003D10ACF0
MTAFTSQRVALSSAAALPSSAEALIAGPCALPEAPLAMPPQVIEAERGLLRRLIDGLTPHRPAAPSAGAGL